jgi:hypothetical protein
MRRVIATAAICIVRSVTATTGNIGCDKELS